jgi:hypothetical protein
MPEEAPGQNLIRVDPVEHITMTDKLLGANETTAGPAKHMKLDANKHMKLDDKNLCRICNLPMIGRDS